MADPILPGRIRAQVVLEANSGLAEDRYVTTWGFSSADNSPVTETHRMEVWDKLRRFYTGLGQAVHQGIGGYLGAQIRRDAATIRMYDLGQAPPRDPDIRDMGPIPSRIGTRSYPAELAVCMSFRGPQNRARQRGRVYLGPLDDSVRDEQTGSDVRVGSSFRQLVVNLGQEMAEESSSATWSIISPTASASYRVEGVWVDDAFDIQRRRGSDPTTRTQWPA